MVGLIVGDLPVSMWFLEKTEYAKGGCYGHGSKKVRVAKA